MKDIVLDCVSYTYPKGAKALDRISLKITSGEQIAIIGQNGTGKSTLAKLINGLLKPSEGTVWIGDQDTKQHTTAQIARQVGYVFQNPDEQIFHATVGAEVRYGIKKCRPKREGEMLAQQALKITGMDQYEAKNPFDLPLSVRKFVTIAAVMATDPEILILDEPTAGQDLHGKQRLALLLEWWKKQGKTVLMITHDMEFVADRFQKVLVMSERKILYIGKPKEVFWDFELLRRADLEQPYVSALCKELGILGVVDLETAAQRIAEVWKRK